MADSTKRKARKSTNDNPLWLHQSGEWCKKIKGRFVYFGTDLDKALALYTQQRAAWEAGIDPRDGRAVSGSPTIAEVCNAYLDAQHDKRQVGELSARTFQEQRNTCARMARFFGRNRRIDSLRPADFAKLRTKLAGQYGPARLGNEIVRIRTLFKWAFENEVRPSPTPRLAGGMLGAITSRTGFFLSSFQKWREEILLNQSRPTVFADLGYGVLDTAMVETAAYCLVKCQ